MVTLQGLTISKFLVESGRDLRRLLQRPWIAKTLKRLVAEKNLEPEQHPDEIKLLISDQERSFNQLLKIAAGSELDITRRQNSIRLLGVLEVMRATYPLAGVLLMKSTHDVRLRSEAAAALGKVLSERSADALREVLRDPEPRVTQAALEALKNYASNATHQRAVECIAASKNENVQIRALELLLEISSDQRDNTSIRVLKRRLLQSGNIRLLELCIDALKSLGTEEAWQALSEVYSHFSAGGTKGRFKSIEKTLADVIANGRNVCV